MGTIVRFAVSRLRKPFVGGDSGVLKRLECVKKKSPEICATFMADKQFVLAENNGFWG